MAEHNSLGGPRQNSFPIGITGQDNHQATHGRRIPNIQAQAGATYSNRCDNNMDVDMGLGTRPSSTIPAIIGRERLSMMPPPPVILTDTTRLGDNTGVLRLDSYKSPSAGSLDISMSIDSYALNVVEEGKRTIRNFLQSCKCYEVIKNSGKVVVFDVKIPMNLAFFALVEHHIKCVPLWDADQGRFVGMFTATDFVNILRHFYNRGSPMTAAAEHSIASWKNLSMQLHMTPASLDQMVYITPEDTLYNACLLLWQHRLHRLSIFDPEQNSVLSGG
jgi:CBS domain-containing protein